MFARSMLVVALAAGVAIAAPEKKPVRTAEATKTATTHKTADADAKTKTTATADTKSTKSSGTKTADAKKTATVDSKRKKSSGKTDSKKSSTKSDAKKSTKKKTASAASSKKKKVAKKDSRVPTRSTGNNMPRGWVWPPNKTMVASGKACEAKLDELSVTWKPAEREGHIVAAITSAPMTFGGVKYVPTYGTGARKMDCHLAVALQTFGADLFNVGVREVHFGSIYRWSKVRVGGLTKNLLSRHALGLAMDIVSFTDDKGRTAYVSKDYQKDDALLLAVEHAVNTSGKFRLLLTPKNDPISHKDHFHLEANPDFTSFTTTSTTTAPVQPPVPASDDVPSDDDAPEELSDDAVTP